MNVKAITTNDYVIDPDGVILAVITIEQEAGNPPVYTLESVGGHYECYSTDTLKGFNLATEKSVKAKLRKELNELYAEMARQSKEIQKDYKRVIKAIKAGKKA
jgi:hypothetical protein